MKHIKYLKKLDACSEAVVWAKEYPTLQKAWDDCERGDWMLWLIGKQSGDPGSKSRKKLVLTACKCARLSLKHIPENEKRPLKAIQTAEKYAKGVGNITLQNVKYAAYAAATAVGAYTAAAAYAAATAVGADADVAAAYAYASAGTKTLRKCADIVRKDYPKIRMIKL